MAAVSMIEVTANDRLGGKGKTVFLPVCCSLKLTHRHAVRVKCRWDTEPLFPKVYHEADMPPALGSPDDTIGDLKKLIAAQKGTKPEKVGIPSPLRMEPRCNQNADQENAQIVLKKWYTM